MQEQWILDLLICDGDYVGNPDDVEGSLWLVVTVDGANGQFSTIRTGFSEHPVWNSPHRVILNVSNIRRAFMYFTLCTFGSGGVGVIPIGRSRVCLNSMPIGNPKLFSFPIMNVKNSSVELMSIRVTATLSLLSQEYHLATAKPHSDPVPRYPVRYDPNLGSFP